MLGIELAASNIDHLFQAYANRETIVATDLKKQALIIEAGPKKEKIQFSLSDFDRELVTAGGWVEYADSNY